MGRAARWLSCLLGAKKEAKDRKDRGEVFVGESKEKRRWSFAMPREAAATAGSAARSSVSERQARSRTPCYDDKSAEDNRRAIAVAMATSAAAAASAAATVAHAAALRLSSLGRERATLTRGYSWWAAVKIQAAFRGYLARKALRSLRAMVKLQALIRGSLVRRQTAATLQQLQALVRIQALTRTRRCSRLLQEGRSQWIRQEIFPRRSFEKSRGIEARIKYFASAECQGLDRSPKVVDMDTCRAKLRSLRRTNSHMLHPPEELPSSPISSPFKLPARIAIPDFRTSQDCNYRVHAEKVRYCKTAHNTPRYTPVTPTKSSVAVDGFLRQALHAPSGPNYMAKTRSSSAKSSRRSKSTPRQHRSAPESPRLARKRITAANDAGYGVAAGYRSQVHEARRLKNLMAGRPDEAVVEVTREESRDHFFEQKESRDYYLDVMW